MFEGKPPFGQQGEGNSAAAAHAGAAPEALRELTWGDLRARLEAARDLRASLVDGDPEDPASFDAPSARCIAELGNDQHSVNFTDLANGKGLRPIIEAPYAIDHGKDPRK